jgi:hypothetical protein
MLTNTLLERFIIWWKDVWRRKKVSGCVVSALTKLNPNMSAFRMYLSKTQEDRYGVDSGGPTRRCRNEFTTQKSGDTSRRRTRFQKSEHRLLPIGCQLPSCPLRLQQGFHVQQRCAVTRRSGLKISKSALAYTHWTRRTSIKVA